MTIAYTREPIIVCGLVANSVQLTTQLEYLDVAKYDDPLGRIALPTMYLAAFRFILSSDDVDIAYRKFEIGSGTKISDHDLGPADVCQYCGTAWLPGTLRCPACGGETDHFERAIEYAAKRAGYITNKNLLMTFDGVATLDVTVEYTALEFGGDSIASLFKHSLWSADPALWVCGFCGHMVHGHTTSCPGCGGRRQKIDKLATQYRECLYCGRMTIGGYACPACNMRLKARDKQRQWSL
jgi:RNA polymerase subunit RPABC4/transcription elongation factor Spt4